MGINASSGLPAQLAPFAVDFRAWGATLSVPGRSQVVATFAHDSDADTAAQVLQDTIAGMRLTIARPDGETVERGGSALYADVIGLLERLPQVTITENTHGDPTIVVHSLDKAATPVLGELVAGAFAQPPRGPWSPAPPVSIVIT